MLPLYRHNIASNDGGPGVSLFVKFRQPPWADPISAKGRLPRDFFRSTAGRRSSHSFSRFVWLLFYSHSLPKPCFLSFGLRRSMPYLTLPAILGVIYSTSVAGMTIHRRTVDFFDPAHGGGSILANATFGGEPLNVSPRSSTI